MPYCISCGVKLSDRENYCILCHRPLEYPGSREDLFPLYPEESFRTPILKRTKSSKEWIIMNLIGFITLLTTLITTGLNYIISDSLTWSSYSTPSIVYLYFSILAIVNLRGHFYSTYIVLNILLAIFLYVIDLISPQISWFLDFALPPIIYLQIFSGAIYIIFKFVRSKLLKVSIVICLLSFYLNIIDFNTLNRVGWSIISSSVFLPIALYIVFLKILTRRKSY